MAAAAVDVEHNAAHNHTIKLRSRSDQCERCFEGAPTGKDGRGCQTESADTAVRAGLV